MKTVCDDEIVKVFVVRDKFLQLHSLKQKICLLFQSCSLKNGTNFNLIQCLSGDKIN